MNLLDLNCDEENGGIVVEVQTGESFMTEYLLTAKYKDNPFLFQVTVVRGVLTVDELKSLAFLKIKENLVDYNTPSAKVVFHVIGVNFVIYKCRIPKCPWKSKIIYVSQVTEADEHDLALNDLEIRFIIFFGSKGVHSTSEHKKEDL
jgi:hypothetical protein